MSASDTWKSPILIVLGSCMMVASVRKADVGSQRHKVAL